MNNLYARAVFFVANAERALRFYVEKLGFKEDWSHKEGDVVWVCQVSLFGFEVILNQIWHDTETRRGQGRVFIGLEDEQIEPLLQHVRKHNIPTERDDWGQPTLVIKDLDGNELFFWDWPEKHQRKIDLTKVTAPA